MRHALKALGKDIIVSMATGCMEVVTTPYPETAWRVPWIHVAFENTAAVASGIEAALKVLGKKHVKSVAIAGDGGTADIGLQALSGAIERGHNFLYICYDNEAYMNCLSTSSLIMTKDGLKRITEVEVGDEIYAFDQKTHTLVLKRCTGVFDNGRREVFELETSHHTIRATSNHPFLVLKRNGRGRRNALVWKTLSELRVGDEVVVLNNLDGGKPFEFTFDPPRSAKATRLKKINLPKRSSPALMKYLGIWVGDGWVRPERGEVGFALPKGSKERRCFLKLHSSLFSVSPRIDGDYVYVDSVDLARFIDSLAFGSGAKNKTIPAWVFTTSEREREAFVEGLMLSDGYKVGNSCRYVSASIELLRRLRLLLQTMGYRVGKIHVQKKEKGKKCVHRKLLKEAVYGYVCFSKKKKSDAKTKYLSQYRYRNFLIENEHFGMEKIRKITRVGKESTLDLRVEDEHNFVADGIIVHNTGIQRSGATPYKAWTTTTPIGKVKQGEDRQKKDLPAIVAAHGAPYVATASVAYPLDFIKKVKKAAAIEGPTYIHVHTPCTPGWRIEDSKTIEVARLAVLTGSWVLYEIEQGRLNVTFKPPKRRPVMEYLKLQGRFKHLIDEDISEIQQTVDEQCKRFGIE
jgi:pyruvate/2-oxoacid:ferredoxin oxidoreductase beta subunit